MNRVTRFLICFLVLCLCVPAQATAEEELRIRVSDPMVDIAPLIDWMEAQQGNLLRIAGYSSYERNVLTAGPDESFALDWLYSSFVNGVSYIFTLNRTQTLAGITGGISVLLYDFNAEQTIDAVTLIPNHDAPQAWVFTIPEDADVSNLHLLIYAGEAGKTSDNSVLFEGLGLYMWMHGDGDREIINALQPLTR